MLPLSLLNVLQPLVHLLFPDGFASSQPPLSKPLSFELRHLHAVTSSAQVYFSDIPPSSPYRTHSATNPDNSIILRPRRITRHRPSSPDAFSLSRTRSITKGENDARLGWEEDEVEAPDVESRETLLVLAKMTSNAYYDGPDENGWYDLGGNWTAVRIWLCRIFVVSYGICCMSRQPRSGGNLTRMAFAVIYS